MKKEEVQFLSNDQKTMIHAIRWIPEGKPRAILQLVHGMAEYIDRYHEFAVYLAEQGILVTGNDHLGHGESIQDESCYGYFAETNGNRILLQDLNRLQTLTQEQYPGIPYLIMGHSMGSFLTRQYLCCYGDGLDGAVIMGTGSQPRFLTGAGMMITRILAALRGWKYRSRLVENMAVGAYAKNFPGETGNEWLSRNEENVARYTKDARCGFRFTVNGYYNLFYSIHTLSDRRYLEKMPKELPVFFVAGEEDPVGACGKGVKKAFETFQKIGMKHVSCRLYPQDRHEILNEVDRDLVMEDIATWIEQTLKGC